MAFKNPQDFESSCLVRQVGPCPNLKIVDGQIVENPEMLEPPCAYIVRPCLEQVRSFIHPIFNPNLRHLDCFHAFIDH